MEFQLTGKTTATSYFLCHQFNFSTFGGVTRSRRYGSTHIQGAAWAGVSFRLVIVGSPSEPAGGGASRGGVQGQHQRVQPHRRSHRALRKHSPCAPQRASPGSTPRPSGCAAKPKEGAEGQPCPAAGLSRRAEPFARRAAEHSKAPSPGAGRGRYTRENTPREGVLCPQRSSSSTGRREP